MDSTTTQKQTNKIPTHNIILLLSFLILMSLRCDCHVVHYKSEGLLIGYQFEDDEQYQMDGLSDIGLTACVKECLMTNVDCKSVNYDEFTFNCYMNLRAYDPSYSNGGHKPRLKKTEHFLYANSTVLSVLFPQVLNFFRFVCSLCIFVRNF